MRLYLNLKNGIPEIEASETPVEGFDLYTLHKVGGSGFTARQHFLQMTDSTNWPEGVGEEYANAMQLVHEAVMDWWDDLDSMEFEPSQEPLEGFKTAVELLDYPNPEGLHPNEARWRDVARELKRQLDSLRAALPKTGPVHEDPLGILIDPPQEQPAGLAPQKSHLRDLISLLEKHGFRVCEESPGYERNEWVPVEDDQLDKLDLK